MKSSSSIAGGKTRKAWSRRPCPGQGRSPAPLDDAEEEEEECKELILGYHFLAASLEGSYTKETLDGEIERHFREELGADIDFEVDDSLRKLLELGLVTSKGDRLEALPLPLAVEEVERRWTALTLG
jgi:hypothetical protein